MLAVVPQAAQFSHLMQSIGERLEEERKRKGISLREAAEATKIRGDFLSSIEQNKFDFDLPDIYKRGFLKNYARYLRLDEDKIIADFNSQQLSNSRLGKKAGNEWFGSMEIKRDEEASDDHYGNSEDSSSFGRIRAKSPAREEEIQAEQSSEESDQAFYIKIGLVFIGFLAVVFIVFGLIWAILSGSKEGDTVIAQPDIRETAQPIEADTELATESITLIASGNVYVLVKQQNDDLELFRKTMGDGESQVLKKQGSVDILFTAGEFLTVEHNGERLRPSSSGTAKITIP